MKTIVKSFFVLSLMVVFAANNNTYAQTAKPETTLKDVSFNVNLHCDACKEKISKHLAYEKGVKSFNVNLEEKMVSLKFDPAKTNAETLSKSIAKLGYTVTVAQKTQTNCLETKTCPKSKSCCKQQ